MSTKATDLVNIEECLKNDNLMGAIDIWNKSYHGITPDEFLYCCRNAGEFSTAAEVIESINGLIVSGNLAIEDLKKIC